MNRRELLKHLGLAAALPLTSGVLSGCGGETGLPATAKTFQFDPSIRRTVGVIADLIIPETDTPGASDAGVVDFIELMLREWFSVGERQAFLDGLNDIEARVHGAHGMDFVDTDVNTQVGVLESLELEALNERTRMLERGSFISRLKLMTLTGYYTSQVGASVELDNTMAFPEFDGCTEFGPEDRAYSSGVSAPDSV